MKRIKKQKNNIKSLLVLLVVLLFGIVLLGAIQKKQDIRSSAAGTGGCYLCNDEYCTNPISRSIGAIVSGYSIGFYGYGVPSSKAYKDGVPTGRGASSVGVLKCTSGGWILRDELFYYNPEYHSCQGTTAYGTNLSACNTAKRGACYTSYSVCEASDDRCVARSVMGDDFKARCQISTNSCSSGMYLTGLCPGNTTIKCCVPGLTPTPTPRPSCASKGGACVGNVPTCTTVYGGSVISGTTGCSGTTAVCCKL